MSVSETVHAGGNRSEGPTWIQDFAGTPVDMLRPLPEHISPRGLARGLAMTCRFAGHVDRFYSVAEHSVLCVDLARAAMGGDRLSKGGRETLRLVLLHDGHESYMGDATAPLKRALDELMVRFADFGGHQVDPSPWRWMEDAFDEAIRARFDLPEPTAIQKATIHAADMTARFLEGERLKPDEPHWAGQAELPDGIEWACGLDPLEAEALFLARGAELGLWKFVAA